MKLGFLAGYICLSLSIVIMGSCIGETKKMSDQPQGLLSGFEGLAGIDDAKDIHAREQTTLEKLLEIEGRVVPEVAGSKQVRSNLFLSNPRVVLYPLLYDRLEKKELVGLNFDESDLEQFVIAKCNSDNDENTAKVLGFFTSCLLDILTRRNREQDLHTSLFINGSGNRFPFLFSYARDVDLLGLENFQGGNICWGITAKEVICMNIKGNNTLRTASASSMIGIGIKGNYTMGGIGIYSPYVDQAICVDCRGGRFLYSAGSYSGKINQIIAINCSGKHGLGGIGSSNGKVNQVVGVDICSKNSKEIFYRTGLRGKVNQIIYDNIPNIADDVSCNELISGEEISRRLKKEISKTSEEYTTQLATGENADGPIREENADKLTTGENAIGQYQRLIELARGLHGQTYGKILRARRELYALRPKVPEGFFKKSENVQIENK